MEYKVKEVQAFRGLVLKECYETREEISEFAKRREEKKEKNIKKLASHITLDMIMEEIAHQGKRINPYRSAANFDYGSEIAYEIQELPALSENTQLVIEIKPTRVEIKIYEDRMLKIGGIQVGTPLESAALYQRLSSEILKEKEDIEKSIDDLPF